jgi:hypothetical protein
VATAWERSINAGGEYFEDDKAQTIAGMSEKLLKKNSSETF